MRIVDLFLTLLYPPRCVGCTRDLTAAGANGLCRGCRSRLGSIAIACPRCGEPGHLAACRRCTATPPPFRSARACFAYRDDDLSSHLLQRWKYGGDQVVGSILGSLLAEDRKQHAECYEVLVPVPLHAARLAQRGFNQAAVLARAAVRPGERLVVDALRRSERTDRQAHLDRSARAVNVRLAFAVRDPAPVRDRTVLLIDDVLTTGATARACAAVLLAAGARAVDVLSLARTPAPGWRSATGVRTATNDFLAGRA